MEDIYINGYTVNWNKAELTKADCQIALEAKQLAVLQVLASAKGNIVSQQELLERVWQGTVVSSNTLQQTIAQLRKTIGDDGKSQNWIKTHPKLGYSLKVDDRHNQTQKAKPRFISFAILLSILLLIGFVFYSVLMADSSQVSVKQITPITVNDEKVTAVSWHRSSQTFYYVYEQGESYSLVKQKLGSNHIEVIKSITNVYGDIAVSPDGNKLLYARQTLLEQSNTKCIQIMMLDLNSYSETEITGCGKGFHHSPKWLSKDSISYIVTDKNQNNQLAILELLNNKSRDFPKLSESIISYDVDLTNSKLIVLTQTNVLIAALQNQHLASTLNIEQTIELDKSMAFYDVVWLANESYGLVSKQGVEIRRNEHITSSFSLQNNQNIRELVALNEGKYLAILEQDNWNVRQRSFSSTSSATKDEVIGVSKFVEKTGRYKLNGEVSFLSNRSNLFQVWETSNLQSQPYTNVTFNVEDYLWLYSDSTLLFAGDDKLWIQAKAFAPQPLELDIKPLRLYQAIDSWVLLSALHKGSEALLWLNIETKKIEVLPYNNVSWAQANHREQLVVNNDSGKLIHINNNEVAEINLGFDYKLQWRFYLRYAEDGEPVLWFQDKMKNVWRYSLTTKVLNKIGQYDYNALFMTDYSVSTNSMLSDNVVNEKRDLVVLELSH